MTVNSDESVLLISFLSQIQTWTPIGRNWCWGMCDRPFSRIKDDTAEHFIACLSGVFSRDNVDDILQSVHHRKGEKVNFWMSSNLNLRRPSLNLTVGADLFTPKGAHRQHEAQNVVVLSNPILACLCLLANPKMDKDVNHQWTWSGLNDTWLPKQAICSGTDLSIEAALLLIMYNLKP